MPDPYSQIRTVDPAVLQVLINAMEVRAADPRLREIRSVFLSHIEIPRGARVLEVGCGSGPVCRDLARVHDIGQVVGLDPSPGFLTRARELADGIPNLRFDEGDAGSLPYVDGEFDAVVFHTCLTHVMEPARALAEARRVLRAGGQLAIFDGDFSATSVATGDHDPLQACIDAVISGLVNDRWLARRLPGLVTSCGFRVERLDSHGSVQSGNPDYMLTLVDRGADILAHGGRIDGVFAAALKAEARRRVASGEFFGFLGFVSLLARKPG
jgi:SAM-dependent methyltransferase